MKNLSQFKKLQVRLVARGIEKKGVLPSGRKTHDAEMNTRRVKPSKFTTFLQGKYLRG
jgi:hypothetical protein